MSVNADKLKKCQWMSATFEVSESEMMKSLDLETRNLAERGVTADGVQQRAEGIETLARQPQIAEAQREAQALLIDIGDLPQRAAALLGDADPAAQGLARCLQDEADSRASARFSLAEPDRAVYQQARQTAADARNALRQAAETARKAIQVELERRQRALADLDKTLHAQPLPTWLDVLQRVSAYLPASATEPADLKQHAAPLEGLQRAAAERHDSGTAQAFDDAVHEATQGAALALKALQAALLAETAEQQRRVTRDHDLNQRRAAAPLDRVAALEIDLADKVDTKKDKRLAPMRARVVKAREEADALLLKLPPLAGGAAAPFDALALQCDSALDTLVQHAADAEAQVLSRQNFTAYSALHRVILGWGAKEDQSGADPRLVNFRLFWKSLDLVLLWTDMEANQLVPLQGWKGTLDAVQADRDTWNNGVDAARRLVKDGEALITEITRLCDEMDMEIDDLRPKYPALVLLCAASANIQTDYTTLDYPGVDLVLACQYLADIVLRWTPLVNNAGPAMLLLRAARALLPVVTGAVVIVFTPQLKAKDVVKLMPHEPGNAMKLAADIVTQPKNSPTLFYCGGHRVYHSSSGSGNTSDAQMGSVFWILQDDNNLDSNREIVAIGKHVGNNSNVYGISWLASGVSCWRNKDQKNQLEIRLADANKGLS